MSENTKRTRRLIVFGFLLTLPTVLFWLAVFASRFLGMMKLADHFLVGSYAYLFITFFLPFSAIIVSVFSRMQIINQEDKTQIYAEQSNNMKLNKRLLNWCVLLFAILVIALLID